MAEISPTFQRGVGPPPNPHLVGRPGIYQTVAQRLIDEGKGDWCIVWQRGDGGPAETNGQVVRRAKQIKHWLDQLGWEGEARGRTPEDGIAKVWAIAIRPKRNGG